MGLDSGHLRPWNHRWLAHVPLTFRNRAGLLAGIYIVDAITATFVVKLQWKASNVAGHNKRSASVALIAGSFSFGNIFGPQNFQAKDAPQYTSAKIIVLATQPYCCDTLLILPTSGLMTEKYPESRQGGRLEVGEP